MLVPYENKHVETSVAQRSHTFGIKNPAIFFDILCNRMYAKPLVTCVQEYICNARDSHREAGKEDVPIKIVLPTSIEPTLTIQDFGVGLSRERIENVFINLGESTKRDSNNQTGGFGIGAKSGWAYSDSFGITTTYNEDKRIYIAFLGESGVGNLDLVAEEHTDEPNNTIISLPIKIDDIDKCYAAVNRVIKTWDTKPIIKPENKIKELIKPEVILSGTEWMLVKDDTYHEASIIILIDDVPYPCPKDSTIYDKYELKDDLRLYLFFNTGDLDLAVNREALQSTEKTLAVIETKSNAIFIEAQYIIKIKLASINTFTEFMEHNTTILKYWQFIKCDIPWKNINIHSTLTGKIHYSFHGLPIKISKYNYNEYTDKLSNNKISIHAFTFKKNDIIFFNDTYTTILPVEKIKRVLNDSNKHYNSIYIIQFIFEPVIDTYTNVYNSLFSYINKIEDNTIYTKDHFKPVISDLLEFNAIPFSALKEPTIKKAKSTLISVTLYKPHYPIENVNISQEDLIDNSGDYLYINKKHNIIPYSVHGITQLLATLQILLPDIKIPSTVLVTTQLTKHRVISCGIEELTPFLHNAIKVIKSKIAYEDWFITKSVERNLWFNPLNIIKYNLSVNDPLIDKYIKLTCIKNSPSKSIVTLYTKLAEILHLRKSRIELTNNFNNIKLKKEYKAIEKELIDRYPLLSFNIERGRYTKNKEQHIYEDIVMYLNCSYANKE